MNIVQELIEYMSLSAISTRFKYLTIFNPSIVFGQNF